jgi:hypothetical protein
MNVRKFLLGVAAAAGFCGERFGGHCLCGAGLLAHARNL